MASFIHGWVRQVVRARAVRGEPQGECTRNLTYMMIAEDSASLPCCLLDGYKGAKHRTNRATQTAKKAIASCSSPEPGGDNMTAENLHQVRLRLRRAIDGKGYEECRIRPSVVVLFLPLLLALLVAAGCVLAITGWALLVLEHVLELFAPTSTRADEEAEQQLQQQQQRERESSSGSLSRGSSSSRLTRVGSFVCGWLWVEGQPVWAPAPAPSSYWDYLLLHRQLRRLVGAAYSGLRSRLLRGTSRGRHRERHHLLHAAREGFFVLARDELRWYTDAASSSRPPLGTICLDAIVEVRAASSSLLPLTPETPSDASKPP